MTSFAEFLRTSGTVAEEELAAAVERTGDSPQLGRFLVDRGLISEQLHARALAATTGYPFHDLSDLRADPDAIALVPRSLSRRLNVLPLFVEGDRLQLAMLDPTDIVAIDDVSSVTDRVVSPLVVAADALQNAFSHYLRSDTELSNLSAQIGENAAETAALPEATTDEDAPVVRFVNLLIMQAINDRASDIHIEPGERYLKVRYRIDGVLHEMQRVDRNIQDGIISRLKIMASLDIAERRVPQDGRISVDRMGTKVDLRIATLPTVWGEKIVMRILSDASARMQMRDLNFSEANSAAFTESITRTNGMVLVTGPTGSGKSTTLYTALRSISTNAVNVITVEDPVEYRMPGINQVQVNPRAGLTFETALRSILRSDPDILLVGEIRDKQTAMLSVEAALTGHLVMSTLHTNDAPSALTRLIEMGCEPYLVSSALTAVVAQRLARRLCTQCRRPADVSASFLESIAFPEPAPGTSHTIYEAVGCAACANTGYRGRVGVHEVMTLSEEIEQLLVNEASSAELRDFAIDQGMRSLRDDGWLKVAAGLTTLDEVYRVTA
ncbi:MAG: ATPase, T2SS/T4P/T4SS family [Leucobacter sp.]